MKILVLGGTGAMGKALAPILVSRGWEVTVTSRTKKSSSENLTYRCGNAHDNAFLTELLQERWNAIVDFMSYSAEEFSDRMERLLSRTDQYIFLSSSRVYTDAKGIIREDCPRLLDAPPDAAYLEMKEYALEKAREENLLRNSGHRNWTIVRPYITYNSNRLQLGILEKEYWLQRALEGHAIVFSKAIAKKLTTMTYGGDVAAVIADLIGNKAALAESLHIASPEPVRWSEVLEIYCDTLEKWIGQRPRVVLTEDLDLSAKEPYRRAQIYYDRLYDRMFSSEKAERLCGHEIHYTAPRDGLRQCLEEFLSGDRLFLLRSCRFEAYADRMAHETWELKRMPNAKQKVKYAICRAFRL